MDLCKLPPKIYKGDIVNEIYKYEFHVKTSQALLLPRNFKVLSCVPINGGAELFVSGCKFTKFKWREFELHSAGDDIEKDLEFICTFTTVPDNNTYHLFLRPDIYDSPESKVEAVHYDSGKSLFGDSCSGGKRTKLPGKVTCIQCINRLIFNADLELNILKSVKCEIAHKLNKESDESN